MRAQGAIAQLGERCNRTAEVVSSNLIGSTIKNNDLSRPSCLSRCLRGANPVQRRAKIWLGLPDELTGTACRCDGWALPRSQRHFHSNGMLCAQIICEGFADRTNKNPATGFVSGVGQQSCLPVCVSLTAVNGQTAEEPWSTGGPARETLTAPKTAAAPLHVCGEACFSFGIGARKRIQRNSLRR